MAYSLENRVSGMAIKVLKKAPRSARAFTETFFHEGQIANFQSLFEEPGNRRTRLNFLPHLGTCTVISPELTTCSC